MKLPVRLSFALLLTACNSGGGNNPAGAGIPEDLPFNEKSLPGINDADFAQAKVVALAAGQAAAPHSQVLIDGDESAKDTQDRQRDFAKLNPDMQRLVRDWQGTCKSNHVKSGKGIEGVPRTGEVYKSSESNVTTGAQCLVEMNGKMESAITVGRFTQEPLSFAMSISASGSGRALYKDGAQRLLVGATSFDFAFTVNARLEREGDITNQYSKTTAGGSVEALRLGQIRFEFINESLDRKAMGKTLATIRISQGGRTFLFTQFLDRSNKVGADPRFFIGNRELTSDEVRAMGEFPFTLNENGPTAMPFIKN